MENNNLISIISAVVASINTLVVLLFAYKKLKPEVKRLEIEVDSEIVDAANLNLEGAKISAQMLLDRINELKTELNVEREARKKEQERSEQSRRDDAEYFRRRIKDVEMEARDLRQWAAKLVKQVVEAGQIPIPYIPTYHESDTKITKPRPDLEAEP